VDEGRVSFLDHERELKQLKARTAEVSAKKK